VLSSSSYHEERGERGESLSLTPLQTCADADALISVSTLRGKRGKKREQTENQILALLLPGGGRKGGKGGGVGPTLTACEKKSDNTRLPAIGEKGEEDRCSL